MASLLLAGAISGCGGGGGDDGERNDGSTIDNPAGNASADLSRLTVEPFPYQSAYIDDDTEFFLSWPSAAEAPRTAQARLYRFLEARGGESRQDLFEESLITGNNNSSWVVRPRFDLVEGGVYFLDVTTALDRRRYAFIVEGGRAANPPAAAEQDPRTRGVDIDNNGGTGSLSNLTLRYTGDVLGPVGIADSSSFVLQFPSDASAPSRMTVNLRRYKERRGDDEPSGDEQRIELSHEPGSGAWTVRRRDNFLLERGATYILEVIANGEPQRNYVFLTEG